MFTMIERVGNTLLVPVRVFSDKIYDVINDENKSEKEIERIYQKNKITEYLTFFGSPTEVHPRIFLGSACNAACFNTLKHHNIRFIINVSSEISNYYPNYFEYYQIKIKDNNNESMYEYFDESFQKIENFLNDNEGNILIHCFMGASRSATVVAKYISKKTGRDIISIIKEMKERRNVVNPTQQFLTDLIREKEEIQ